MLKAVLLSVLQCLHMLHLLCTYEASFSLCWCFFLHAGHTHPGLSFGFLVYNIDDVVLFVLRYQYMG